jgi:sigma-B regulation protein RsbU (phosphoserine phosphatase)
MTADSSQERRRSARLLLTPPLIGEMGGRNVAIHEIGLLGGRVEHDSPMVPQVPSRLTVVWEGEEIVVDCTVAHSEKLHVDASRFSSGLKFASSPSTQPGLRKLVAAIAAFEEIDRLRKVVEASKLINSSIEADTLLASILNVATNELGVERGTLYFVDEAKKEIWSKIAEGLAVREIRLPMGKGIAGTVAATGEPVILFDAYADPRFDASLDQKSGYRTRSMLCAPIRSRDGRVVGVLQLLNKKLGSFGAQDLEFLAAISDHMAIAMENATLHLSLLEKNRMERELQLGREIQKRLFPRPPVDVTNTELAAESIPCFEVGGDYYDFIEFGNGDLGLAIADVSGKGVSAAMIMSSVQAALRMAAPIEPDLGELASRLNALLFRMAGGRKYVTFFFGRYAPTTGELEYVNAGHCPAFLVSEGTIEDIPSTGRPIGILPDATFHTGRITLPAGSTLFLYTDGLNEANNPDEREFGMDRLRETVRVAADRDPESVARYVVDRVREFENGAHASDDKTIVVVRRAWGQAQV